MFLLLAYWVTFLPISPFLPSIDKVSLYTTAWLGIHCVKQAGLELTEICSRSTQRDPCTGIKGFKAMHHHALMSLDFFIDTAGDRSRKSALEDSHFYSHIEKEPFQAVF